MIAVYSSFILLTGFDARWFLEKEVHGTDIFLTYLRLPVTARALHVHAMSPRAHEPTCRWFDGGMRSGLDVEE